MKQFLIIFLILSTSSESSARMFQKEDAYYIDIYEFKEKLDHQVLSLNKESEELINKYSDYVYQLKIYQRTYQKHLRELFKAMQTALELDLIHHSHLTKLRRMSHAATGFEFTRRHTIENILWWIQARSFKDQGDFLSFLKLQAAKGDKNRIVNLLIEKGLLDEASVWFENRKIDMLTEKTIISNHHKNIIQSLSTKNNTAALIKTAYVASIKRLFADYEQHKEIESRHINWLLLTLNNHQKQTKIKKLLNQLNHNWLTFHPKYSETTEIETAKELTQTIAKHLSVEAKISMILNINKTVQDEGKAKARRH